VCNFLNLDNTFIKSLTLVLILMFLFSCSKKIITSLAKREYVEHQLKRLSPVHIKFDRNSATENDIKVIRKLAEAAKIIDELFLLQVYENNPRIKGELEGNPEYAPYLELFNIMFGPWNRIDGDKPFINNIEKPLGAAYYPEDMSKKEFLNYIKVNPDQRKLFESNFTVIRRRNVMLVAIPYHEYYRDKVESIAKLLKEAASITNDSSLKKYLNLRAKGFLTDDYYESDLAWMDLNGNLEVVIGPYEVYEDKLFGYKAAYEAFICVVDKEESEKLKIFQNYIFELENNLPIPDKYKSFKKCKSSPIKVVNEVFSAGDTKAGIQTTAFNLPNDERVRKAKGSKKVMLKNIAEAKYEKCWIPIVQRILAEKPLQNVSFDAYFNHVLLHEISHGLGPDYIKVDGNNRITVRNKLKELYPMIEECKADVLGIYNMIYLIDKGVIKDISDYQAFSTYLGGMFRSIRFGIDEAHGGGVLIQFNYLMKKGAISVNRNGKLDFDMDRMKEGIRSLANELLVIQAEGDYNRAKNFINTYRVVTPLVKDILIKLEDLPIDIKPIYPKL